MLCHHITNTTHIQSTHAPLPVPQNNPCQQMVIFLKDTSSADLNSIIEFIYKGSVNVAQTQLASFIKAAEALQIRGLSGEEDKVRMERGFPFV